MFARKLLGFSLACVLAASPAFAFEEYEPFPVKDTAAPSFATDATEPSTAAFDLPVDKFVSEERIEDSFAAGSDAEPVDAES